MNVIYLMRSTPHVLLILQRACDKSMCQRSRMLGFARLNFLLFSPADMCNLCYNCANNGKGAKFGTNEADIISINNRIGGILKLSYFWQNFNMPILHKGF